MKARLEPRINLVGRTPLETVIPLATPFIVFVDPASSCNFKCTFCPTGHRDMIAETGRFQGAMKFEVFQKIIDDLGEFDKPIKVLRMYKDGEPFLNKRLADMVAYAKKSGRVEYIDTTTNGTFLSPDRVGPVLEAGIDKINISVDGMTEEDLPALHRLQVRLQEIRRERQMDLCQQGQLRNRRQDSGELITEAQRQEFFDTFGDHCDRIFVENFAPCWPEFDIEKHTGVKISKGIYQQDIGDTDTCPYIFYGYSVNADGLVSSCFLDWGRKLIIGDVRKQSMKEIWNSERDERAAAAASRGQPAAEWRLRQLRPAEPLPAGQYRCASPDAAGEIQDAGARRSRRRAAGRRQPQIHRRGGGMKILHVTPHLGGGVGKAHAAISAVLPEMVEQTFVLLEAAARSPLRRYDRSGWRAVIIADNLDHVAALAREADIVQFEFWNHPRLFECLARTDFPANAQRVLVAYFGAFQAADSAGADGGSRASSLRRRLHCPQPRLPRFARELPRK